ncbi:MAG: PqqD family protein [Nitrospirota bacterium]|nr:PqqD family protein [Nitrospirota bacterium]
MVPDLLGRWCPVPIPGLRFRELQDGAILLDPTSQKVHSLNERAAIVWLLCDGTRSAQRILELVAPTDETLQASVKEVLETFRREGLVESVSNKPPC